AGLMVPQVLATIAVAFQVPAARTPAAQRSWRTRIAAFSPYGVVVAVTAPIAPLPGQHLTDWRLVFLLHARPPPAAWTGTRALVREWPTQRVPRMLPGGALVAGFAALLLIFPLTAGRGLGWPSWVAVPLVLAVVLLGAVSVTLAARRRRGRATSVALQLFAT